MDINNFLTSEIDNNFLLYTLLEKYICKDIGSRSNTIFDMFMKYGMLFEIPVLFYYNHIKPNFVKPTEPRYVMIINCEIHVSAIYVDSAKKTITYINSGLGVNIHNMTDKNVLDVFQNYDYSANVNAIDQLFEFLNTRNVPTIENFHKLIYFCCDNGRIKRDPIDQFVLLTHIEAAVTNTDISIISKLNKKSPRASHNIPLQILGTCSYHSILYTYIYHTVNITNTNISTFSTDLDGIYKKTKIELGNKLYKDVLNVIQFPIMHNIHHTSIQILKLLYRKYKHKDMLSLIIKYYDEYKYNIQSTNVNIGQSITDVVTHTVEAFNDFPSIMLSNILFPSLRNRAYKMSFMEHSVNTKILEFYPYMDSF